ncbi:hypothetical protein [Kitasatospora sp. NRRL B-11411]|uniref:hypothetical protein n=1 Tax=Kitasatospora sp. NRRL B-11411 TaxID=1463822 RepID=UPI0004C2B693|nr:hypothetical protein [Kitasatospora sp. NRRL B-11411]
MADQTLLLERTARWRGTSGPDGWADAWERALTELTPYAQLGGEEGDYLPKRWTEGAAGLALAYYLLAADSDTPVAEVLADDVRALATADPDTRSTQPVVARIDGLVERAGHRLDDVSDPVAACWLDLREDCSPTAYGVYDDMALATGPWRWGHDKAASLAFVLEHTAAASSR